MKVFTLCLAPMALIGAGIALAIGVKLFYFGWNLGKEAIHWMGNRFFEK